MFKRDETSEMLILPYEVGIWLVNMSAFYEKLIFLWNAFSINLDKNKVSQGFQKNMFDKFVIIPYFIAIYKIVLNK